ncbi:MAG: ATP-binding protein [Rikenellaceae bacterium]
MDKYQSICKTFKIGYWSANPIARKIQIDNNLASLLQLSSYEYSYDEVIECAILTDKSLFESILTSNHEYPLSNWEVTLKIEENTYHLEIIFELSKDNESKDIKGYARIEPINNTNVIKKTTIVGTPHCIVHNTMQTELQDHNVRMLSVCRIGIINPWTWCLKRGVIEIIYSHGSDMTKEEVTLNEFIEAIHPEEKGRFKVAINRILKNKSCSLRVSFRSKYMSNQYKWYEVLAEVMECHNIDKRNRCVGILHDINDKKINEEALKRSDNLLRNIYDNIPVGIELYDKDGILLETNQKNLDIFGISKDTPPTDLNIFNDPSLLTSFKENLKKKKLTEACMDYDLDKIPKSYYSTSAKGVIHIISRGTPLFNAKNDITNYLVVHVDETENATNRSRIHDFEKLFSAVAEYAQIGYCKWDILSKKGFAIDQWFLNFGEPIQSDIDNIIMNHNNFHPDDKDLINGIMDDIIAGSIKSSKHELRVKSGNSYKWIYHNIIVTKYDPKNGSIETVGINIDISKYKSMESQLTDTIKRAEGLIFERNIVIDNLAAGLIYVNTDYKIQWESTTVLRAIYNKDSYIKGEVCYKTAYNRDEPCENCPLTEMIRTGKRAVCYRNIKGMTLEMNANPIFNKSGKLTGGVIQILDITTRTQQERKINELNQLMDAILSNIPVNIYVKDPANGFKYLYWNDAIAETFQIRTSDIIGKTDYDVFPLEIADRYDKMNREQLEKNIEKHLSEEVLVDYNGNEHYVNVLRLLIPNEDRAPLLMGVSWDITEIKEYQKKLIAAKENAEKSNQIKSAFLANMSHEIRTPLNAIVGFSELMTEDGLNQDDKNEYIGIIRRNNELLLQLISDILDLSKIEAHMLEFNYGIVNINVLCNRIVMASNLRSDALVPITFDPNSPEYLLYTDENRLQQIIVNLVNNAMKFTKKGSIDVSYKLLNDQEILISIQDTGVGIPKDKVDAIFDRFIKLDSFIQGTGLGLSICKNLIEKFNGRIGVKSKVGEGSLFWFTLPYNAKLTMPADDINQ